MSQTASCKGSRYDDSCFSDNPSSILFKNVSSCSDVNHTYWIDDRVKYLLSAAFSAEVPPMLTCHEIFVSTFDGSCPMTISLKSLGVHKYASVSFSPSLI